FRARPAVGVRRVDEVHAAVQRVIHDRERVAGLGVGAEIHRSEANSADSCAAAAKMGVVHTAHGSRIDWRVLLRVLSPRLRYGFAKPGLNAGLELGWEADQMACRVLAEAGAISRLAELGLRVEQIERVVRRAD